ncbi:MAG: hypothetical protein Q8K75_05080 [Chlamydiales bacterium]|nr:hypothetical protein [Chlamydiales bacterium]
MDPTQVSGVSTTTSVVMPKEQKVESTSSGKMSFCLGVLKNLTLVTVGAAGGAYLAINYQEQGKEMFTKVMERLYPTEIVPILPPPNMWICETFEYIRLALFN